MLFWKPQNDKKEEEEGAKDKNRDKDKEDDEDDDEDDTFWISHKTKAVFTANSFQNDWDLVEGEEKWNDLVSLEDFSS